MKHLNIHVCGRVQGVGFRFSCLRQAQQRGISGFVKNEYDGSVYIEAEGSEEQLDLLLHWCNNGPSYARVETVKSSKSDLVGFTSFVVK